MAVTKEELGRLQQVFNQLKALRQPYTRVWKQIARYIDPWYGDMDMDSEPGPNPLPSKTDLYDSTVGYYSKTFATGLQGYTCSSQSAFFELEPEEGVKAKGNEDFRKVLQARTRKMYKVFSGAGFYNSLHKFFKSFGDLGTAIMMFGIDRNGKIYYEYVPNYKCLLMKDGTTGKVDTLFRVIWLTRYEALKLYGEDKLPKDIRDNRIDPTKKYKFIQLICPRDRFELSVDNDFKYLELVWYPGEEKTVFEGGADQLRFAACPFAEGEDESGWGVGSPGMRQYQTAHSLQNMMRDQLNASQLLAAPPIKKTEGLNAQIKPGGFINVPPGGDIAPMPLGQDISWTNAARQDLRQIAKADYFVDYFLMLSQYSGQVNTATLAEGLQNEQLKMMTFFLDSLKNAFFEPLIDWTWNTMGQMGMFDDGFNIDYKRLQVDFVSPLYRLQRQAVTLEPTVQAMQAILPYVQIDQKLLSYIDFGGYVEAVAEGTNADARVIRSKDEAMKMMQAQEQQQAELARQQQAIQQQDADTRSYEATLKAPEQGSAAQSDSSANKYANLRLR